LYKIETLITQSAIYTLKSPKFESQNPSKFLEVKLLKLNLKWWGVNMEKKQLWKSSFIFKLQV